MKVDVYNQKNEKAGTMELPDRIFKVKWSADLVHRALAALLSNRRQPWAHTKDRSEVSGGGRKPWKQKGTGRARHGSIRSPLWKGGGVTFGPRKERNYSKKINKKMNQKAIFSVLSNKLESQELKIIDSFGEEILKTKKAAEILKKFVQDNSSILIIPSSGQARIKRVVANIKKVDALSPLSLNVYDLLKSKNIILAKKAVEEIEKTYNLIS